MTNQNSIIEVNINSDDNEVNGFDDAYFDDVLEIVFDDLSQKIGSRMHLVCKKVVKINTNGEDDAFLCTFIYSEYGDYPQLIFQNYDTKPIPTDQESLLFYAELVEIPFDKKRFN